MTFESLIQARLLMTVAHAAFALAFFGCAAPDQDAPADETVGAEFALEVPSQWIGEARGVPPPTLTLIGKVATGGHARPKHEPRVISNRAQPPSAIDDRISVVYRDGRQFMLNYSAEQLAAIGEEVHRRGLDQPSDPAENTASDKGWAGGVDNRTRWTGTTTPRRYIGALVEVGANISHCTGTLVGQRIVVTAAHCVVNLANQLINNEFVAARDGDFSAPYGRVSWNTAWYLAGAASTCAANYGQSLYCRSRDWAVLVLDWAPTDSTGATAGGMGFHSTSNNTNFSNYSKNNAGYPHMGDFPPATCTSDWMYRTTNCSTGTLSASSSYAAFDFGCDTSEGHSGGPIWSTSSSIGSGNYLLGVYHGDWCKGGAPACNQTNPNVGARITQAVYDTIAAVKAANP